MYNYKKAHRKIKAGYTGELFPQIKQLIEAEENVVNIEQVRDGINQVLSAKYYQLTGKSMPSNFQF